MPRHEPAPDAASRRARAIFEAALERRASERIAYIDGACAIGGEALRAEVLALLDGSERPGGYFSGPPPQAPPDRATAIANAAAAHRSRTERIAFIEGACGADAALRARVVLLLAAAESGPPPPPLQSAAEAFYKETSNQERNTTTEDMAREAAARSGRDELGEATRIAPAQTSAESPPASPPTWDNSSGATSGSVVQEARTALEGRRLGPYQILYRIGKGGMGSVYAASRADQEYKKTVAIKMVSSGLGTEEMLRRFRTERQLLASLDHPYIGRLLDGGTTEDGLPYLVMEYVEGLPIDAYCRNNRVPLRQKLELFQKVCDAVHFAHQNLVVHRDIKPGNILVSSAGEPKLLDFGIAKMLTAEFSVQEIELNRGEVQPMTIRYASPEQVRNEAISTASDTYSLGTLLFELLTGRHPLQHALTSRAAIEQAILKEEPEKPSLAVRRETPENSSGGRLNKATDKLSGRLRGDLDAIVLMALRKEPQQRYASVERFNEDIGRYLDGLPVHARSHDLSYRAGKFIRRHVVTLSAAALIAIALLVSTIVSVRFARTATAERMQAERRFSDVRKLAHFVLFDFDNAVREGPTAARKLLVTKALAYLNDLAKDASGNVSLERELVDGYLKVGDLQGNPSGPNLGDVAGARATYLRALQSAEALRARFPGDLEVRRIVADVNTKLGDFSLVSGSDPVEALKYYPQAQAIFESMPANDPGVRGSLITILRRIGFLQLRMGNTAGAMRSYERALRTAQELYAANRGDLTARRLVGLSYSSIGQLYVNIGSYGQGLQNLTQAEAIYREIAASSSSQPGRDTAVVLAAVGLALQQAGRSPEAVDYDRRSLKISERLAAEDPKNTQLEGDIHVILGRLAEALAASDQPAEARQITERLLRILKPGVDGTAASASDVYQYCWLLLTTPFKDLQNPSLARHHAEMLVKSTGAKDPNTLDLLARAQFAGGDTSSAIATEEKALALLPSSSPSELRAELEKNLAKFCARAESKQSRAGQK